MLYFSNKSIKHLLRNSLVFSHFLKNSHFQENIAKHGMWQELDFSDVTLVCEEFAQFKAHSDTLSPHTFL